MSSNNPFVDYSYEFPIVITSAGLQPQTPASLQQQLIANIESTNPGYTANLPGSLVEDVSSTEVAGIALCDQAKVELVNSLTPNGANVFLLTQLGNLYGLQLGTPTNTSVAVVFSGTVGYVIANGLLISDTNENVYQVQGGGVINSSGSSVSLQAIAVNAGTTVPAANTVTTINTSIPATITLTVTNAAAGVASTAAETYYAFRTRVLQAGLAASVGTPRYIKTILGNLLGASANLISVQQESAGLKIVVGGSTDYYDIAYAIFISVADVSTLQVSSTTSRNQAVSLTDYPDTYTVNFVVAPAQTVTMAIVWNTTLANFTLGSSFAGLVQAPLAAYINALGIGQVINVLEMIEIFQESVQNVLPAQYLTRLVFTVSINGTPTSPASGTYAISGDVESYFTCAVSGITVTQD